MKIHWCVCIFAEHIELSCRWRCRCNSRCSWSVSGLNLIKLISEVNIRNHSNWEMEKKRNPPEGRRKIVERLIVWRCRPSSCQSDIFHLFRMWRKQLSETVSKEWQRGGEGRHPANKKNIGLVTQRGGSHGSGKTEIITLDIQHFFRFLFFSDILFF